VPGLYGNTNILDIASGPIGSTGGFIPISWQVAQLSVSVYNASGDFLYSRTFNENDSAQDPTSQGNITYFQKYALNIDGQSNTKGAQINIQGILGDYGFNLPQGIYHIVTNFVQVIDSSPTIQQISTDRKEVRLVGTPGADESIGMDFGENHVPIHLGHHKFDLGTGKFVVMVNWTLDDGDLICKLDQPLPIDVFVGGTYHYT